MIGRLIIGIAALALIVGIATGGVGLYSRQHRPHYTFWNAEGTEVDTAANADSVFLTAYSTQYTGADTAGHPNRLTYAKSDSGGGGWYITNPTWNIYLVVRDSFGTIDTLADDFLIVGRVLGDSTISDTLVFKADVVPGLAIVSMSGTKLDSGTVAQSKIGAGAVDSTRLASNAVHPPHIDTAWDFAFREVSTDTLDSKDSTHIRVIENLTCDSTITIGAYTLPIVDGANGEVLKTDGAGALGWQADAGGSGSDFADSLRTGAGTFDADDWLDASGDIDTTHVNDTQWEAYIQTHQSGGAGMPAADFDDSLAAQGFVNADSTGGPLATRYWAGTQYLLLASFDDSIAVTASTELSDTADLLYESELDAFSELQTQIGDKTLVNEEDVCTIDANWVNTANPWAVNEVHGDLLTATEGNAAYLALAAFADSIAVTASTELTDTAEILYETELNTFAELQTQIADKVLVNTTDAANMVLATVTGTVDMGGATLEIPNGTDPDITVVGQISNDTDAANETGDVSLRGFDGSNQFCYARKLDNFGATIVKPNDFADATRDKLQIWSNETGMTFTITKIEAWSDVDDTAFTVEEYDADGASNQSDVDEINCTTGIGPYTDTETTITAGVIEAGHTIWLDFDDTDDPGQVKVTICGWYNADVD